jgi:glycosyltransferase involved in cell wall biosynthesis
VRVAYVYFLMENASFGVTQKVRQQARSIERSGMEGLDIYVLNPSINEESAHLKFVSFKGVSFYPVRVFYYLFNKRALIESAIDLDKYDRVILRHSFSDGSLLGLMNKVPVVLEFHSKIITELEVKLADTQSILKKIIRSVRIGIEKRFLYQLLNKSSGFITMGKELAEHYSEKSDQKTPHQIIFNGCDVANINVTGFKPFDGKEFHLVFLGSRPDPWHGIPRLVNAIKAYKQEGNQVDVNLHFIGNISAAEVGVSDSEKGFHFHGVLKGIELDDAMSKMNMAACTMAQYMKQLDETSAIKTVEYLARGIPFLIAYEDTALTGQESLLGTYMKFPNDDSPIDLKPIIEFSKRVSQNKEAVTKTMRDYAENECDWAVKMKEYLAFSTSLKPDFNE